MMQVASMYFIFLWEVVKRAFTPTARVTDVLQILAASTLPAASRFAGLDLPSDAGDSALAYIGLIAVSYVVIRLFWAPYSIWKEQGGEIGALKLELSKPERLILEHMAKLRAKARIELSSHLHRMHLVVFVYPNADKDAADANLTKHHQKSLRLAHNCGLSREFDDALYVFVQQCRKRLKDGERMRGSGDFEALRLMQEYLLQVIPIEDLMLRLPSDIEQETPP